MELGVGHNALLVRVKHALADQPPNEVGTPVPLLGELPEAVAVAVLELRCPAHGYRPFGCVPGTSTQKIGRLLRWRRAQPIKKPFREDFPTYCRRRA